jgi:hypothetical protein
MECWYFHSSMSPLITLLMTNNLLEAVISEKTLKKLINDKIILDKSQSNPYV